MPARAKAVSPLEAHLGYWLRSVSNHVSHEFERRVAGRGVSVAEWVVLRLLFDAGADGASPSRVAERLGMTRGAISKVVDRLADKGMAAVAVDPADRRRQSVTLTPAGRAMVPELAALADENEAEFFGHLSASARATLATLLRDTARRHGWTDVPVE